MHRPSQAVDDCCRLACLASLLPAGEGVSGCGVGGGVDDCCRLACLASFLFMGGLQRR